MEKMSIFGDFANDSELMLYIKQIAFGSAIAAAFLGIVYMGGLLAHIVSGTY